MERRPAPSIRKAGYVWAVVVHAGGEQYPPRRLERPVIELELEGAATGGSDDDLPTDLNAWVGGEFLTSGSAQLVRRATVVAEQAADPVGREVALLSRVHDERASPSPAEY